MIQVVTVTATSTCMNCGGQVERGKGDVERAEHWWHVENGLATCPDAPVAVPATPIVVRPRRTAAPMSDTRGDIIRVLHRAYKDNGWMPPTLDGYADALVAAGYGKLPVPDPTHGRIDADIQEAVDKMNPTSLGQRVAIENTLQERRDDIEPSA